jgi:hypothetical protein
MHQKNDFLIIIVVLIKITTQEGHQKFPFDLISGMSQVLQEQTIRTAPRSGLLIDIMIKNQYKKLESNLDYYSKQSSLNSIIPDLSPKCDRKLIQFMKAFQQRQTWATNGKTCEKPAA